MKELRNLMRKKIQRINQLARESKEARLAADKAEHLWCNEVDNLEILLKELEK